jgi:hypothetical protein
MKCSPVLGLAAAVLIGASACVADDMATSIDKGSKAMLFSFNGLSFLGAGSYNGGFGAKYFLTDQLGLRGSLQFAFADQDSVVNPVGTDVGTNGFANATRFGISAGAEYHLMKTRVSPYVGGALQFSTTMTDSKYTQDGPAPLGPQTEVKNVPQTINGVTYTPGFLMGLAGIAGVEFFITKEISLGAEYQLGYSVNLPYDATATTGPTTTTFKQSASWNLAITNGGALTLCVYF